MKVSYPTQFLNYSNLSTQKKSVSTTNQEPVVDSIKKRIHPISQSQKDKLIQDLTLKVAKLRQKYSEQINQYKNFIIDLLKKNNTLEEKIDILQAQTNSCSQIKLFLKQKMVLMDTIFQNEKLTDRHMQDYPLNAISNKFQQSLNKLIEDNKTLKITKIPHYKKQILELKEKIYQLNGQVSKITIDNLDKIDNSSSTKFFRSNTKDKIREYSRTKNEFNGNNIDKIEYYNKICQIFGIYAEDQRVQEQLLEKIKQIKSDIKVLVGEIKKADEKLKSNKVKHTQLKNEIISLKKQNAKKKEINVKFSELLRSYNESIVKENISKLNQMFKNECN